MLLRRYSLHKYEYEYKCVCLRVDISIMVMCDASDALRYDRRTPELAV